MVSHRIVYAFAVGGCDMYRDDAMGRICCDTCRYRRSGVLLGSGSNGGTICGILHRKLLRAGVSDTYKGAWKAEDKRPCVADNYLYGVGVRGDGAGKRTCEFDFRAGDRRRFGFLYYRFAVVGVCGGGRADLT